MKKRTAAVGLYLSAVLVGTSSAAAPLSEVGQCAFAAIAEATRALAADDSTDWTRVNVLALRDHLVDMDEVVMRAGVQEQPIRDGVRIHLSGAGRTLEALRRMIPQHSHMMSMTRATGSYPSVQVDTKELADGYELELKADTPTDIERIRALGFFGFLAAGDHHRHHHWGIASGTMRHQSGSAEMPKHQPSEQAPGGDLRRSN